MHRFIRLAVLLTFITLLGTACGGAVSPTVVPTRVALSGRPTLQVTAPVEGALVGVGIPSLSNPPPAMPEVSYASNFG